MELKRFKEQRKQLKASVTRLITSLTSFEGTLSQLQTRTADFNTWLSKFQETQIEIELLEPSNDNDKEIESFEARYYQAADLIDQITARLTPIPSSPVNSIDNHRLNSPTQVVNSNVKLPTIKLPTFDGNVQEWISFSEIFKSLIDENPTISAIQKFHYLISSLKGEAANIINNIEITSSNYSIAWKMLVDYYQNNRLIAQSHIKNLFALKPMRNESESEIRELLNNTSQHLRALAALKRPVDHWDDLIVHLVSTKFDSTTNREWQSFQKSSTQLPTYKELETFLIERRRMLAGLSSEKGETKKHNSKVTSHSASSTSSCPICQDNHYVYQCAELSALEVPLRIQKVKDTKLCINCLRKGHTSSNCKSKHSCKECGKRHHSILHIIPNRNATSDTQSNTNVSICRNVNLCYDPTSVVLPTALITIADVWGNNHEARALLDSGSQIHLITDELANRLGLQLKSINLSISGISTKTTAANSYISTTIGSNQSVFKSSVDLIVLPKITSPTPGRDFDISQLEIPKNVALADSSFNKSNPVDILIGADIFYKALCVGQIHLSNGRSVLQKTQFGWVLSGRVPEASMDSTSCNVSNIELHKTLQNFWKLDDYDNISSRLTPEEQYAEECFQDKTTQDESGRFVVPLIWRKNSPKLGNSYDTALQRLHAIERKFRKDPIFKNDYVCFIQQYEILGHMKRIDVDDIQSGYYLPHHGVRKETSSTTKLRVVFDGSAKTSSNISLNDTLLPGPTVQQTLFNILIRFRTFKYVITADIVKMYRQVLIREEDRSFQRILWRETVDQPVQIYELQTVTYGTTCAAYLATRVLQELSRRFEIQLPQASRSISRDFYVDDLMTGCNNVEDLIKIRDDITYILNSAGFPLQKLRSNDVRIQNESDTVDKSTNWCKDVESQTLGIGWKPENDEIHYVVKLRAVKKLTKRKIISMVASIFDPLGLLNPVTVLGKILIQRIWEIRLDWDESLPMSINSMAEDYFGQMELISDLRIPRFVGTTENNDFEIHGFGDASENAYGACVYIRTCNENGEYESGLLCSKTRIAPLKKQTIPRLELCAAVLLTKLVKQLLTAIETTPTKVCYYSDSAIVLSWIQSASRKFKTYVSNRIGEIHEMTNVEDWYHIKGEDNPADICSRGITAKELLEKELWWRGPSWLREKTPTVLPMPTPTADFETLPDVKTHNITVSEANTQIIDSTRFSSWNKLLRTIAYVHYIKKIRKRQHDTSPTSYLSSADINEAMFLFIKNIQAKHFNNDILQLNKKGRVYKKSPLLSLSPFLDENGILRVGGRLKHARLAYSAKHPILLPHNDHAIELLIRHEHVKSFHAGIQTTLSLIRQTFWIIRGKGVIRRVIRHCVTCFKNKPTLLTPIMGNLPENRVTPCRPFLECGVDYLGPITIKDGQLRSRKTIKIYIALFICFSTKCIHIEVVCNLTTDTFLAALRRFIARRGKPRRITSDNATNFVGANNEIIELRNLVLKENQAIIAEKLAVEGIHWDFIPPRSPNFGGLWESAVKLFKHHFKRVVGDALLTYEEILTLSIQIEGILNSRPLTAISDDPNDLSYLTPFHFMVGDYPNNIPEPSLLQTKPNHLSRWQRVQQIQQHFWQRWQQDYLSNLQRRSKWKEDSSIKIAEDDLVIISENNQPPFRWKMGRVESLIPGRDKVNRVAIVRTSSGVFKRAVNRLAVLPIN